jgi:hypothetical protein
LSSIRGQDRGFVIDGVLTADVGLPALPSQDPVSVAGIEARILQAMEARPGVSGAAFAYDHPLEANWTDGFTLVGDTTAGVSDVREQAELRIVSPSYFETLGVDVLDGRAFGPADDVSAPGAVLINEALARALPPGFVLGRRLRSAAASYTWGDRVPADYEVVGIVENERFRGAEEPAQPALYVSTRQFPQSSASLLVRTRADPRSVISEVRSTVRAIVPGATVSAPVSLSAIASEQLAVRRVTTDVIGGFAGAALLLAALGLYGLMAAGVSSQRREIGVRMALGATPSLVARKVVMESLANVALGMAAALVLALAAGQVLESLLVGVGARDPLTLTAVGGMLLAVAVLTALGPARRAATVDPARMLRGD